MGLEEIVLRELHVAIINSAVTLIYAKITSGNFYGWLWYSINVPTSLSWYFRSQKLGKALIFNVALIDY